MSLRRSKLLWRPKRSGRLEVLNVEEGDKVTAGEILAILDNSDIRADLDYAGPA